MAPTPPVIYTAFTAPINPPDASPVLTRAQVWQGLEVKVDHAQDFVPVIASTDVISKSVDTHGRNVTVRDVVFKDDGRRIREEVTSYESTKMVFTSAGGNCVQNIISEGADGELYMTFDFQFTFPDMDEAALAAKKEEYKKMSKMAVLTSIQSTRNMVKSGEIRSQ